MKVVAEPVTSKTNRLPPSSEGRRFFARKRFYDHEAGKWEKQWRTNYFVVQSSSNGNSGKKGSSRSVEHKFHLSLGGTTCIHLNGAGFRNKNNNNNNKTHARVKDEMLNKVQYRRYMMNNMFEPRLHALYHAKATTTTTRRRTTTTCIDDEGNEQVIDDEEVVLDGVEDPTVAQPCYCYGPAARMKARPLSDLPAIQKLARRMAQLVTGKNSRKKNEHFWNIGANAIMYRDGHDQIGLHADNNQKENVIMTIIVDCPAAGPRRILIQPSKKFIKEQTLLLQQQKKKKKKPPVWEQIELFLDVGDVYYMDGQMQIHYHHGVLPDKKMAGEGNQRLAIVLRRGKAAELKEDSGEAITDLTPVDKTPPYYFGPVLKQGPLRRPSGGGGGGDPLVLPTGVLHEREMNHLQYGDIAIRTKILDLNAHSGIQSGISGNKLLGADAIFISNPRCDGYRVDQIQAFLYTATSMQSALALVASCHSKHAVRTFRSSDHDPSIPQFKVGQTTYRYDGLAEILCYQAPEVKTGDYTFLMAMMFWDGATNNDPPSVEEYDRVRMLRRAPPSVSPERKLAEDVSRVLEDMNTSPPIFAHRQTVNNDASESAEGDDDDDNNNNNNNDVVVEEEETVDEGNMEASPVRTFLQVEHASCDNTHDTTNRSGKKGVVPLSSRQEGASGSHKRRRCTRTSSASAKKSRRNGTLQTDRSIVSNRRSSRTVVVPPGKLGISIENKAGSTGTVVAGVRITNVSALDLSRGDVIDAIDGEDVSCMTREDVSNILYRKRGSQRTLTVSRLVTAMPASIVTPPSRSTASDCSD